MTALRRLCLLALALLALAACGPAAAEPTPPPEPLPSAPFPAAPQRSPAPPVVEQGAGLPGRLLFVRGGDLWLWQGDSGRQFTSGGGAFQPAWSPDGTRVAYVRRGESYSDLAIMPAAGGEPLLLTSNQPRSAPHSYERIYESVWALYPAFAPDGQTLAFVSQAAPPAGDPAADYHLALFEGAADVGGGAGVLYASEVGHAGRPAYAPDGAAIVFAFAPIGPDAPQLYRYARASGGAEPLPGAPPQSYDPAFAPDGRWLAFAARADGRTDIFALPAGGGPPVRITSLGTARAPAWSPDGALLAFLAVAPGEHAFDLWVVDIQPGPGGAPQAGQPRQITHGLALDADSGVAWAR